MFRFIGRIGCLFVTLVFVMIVVGVTLAAVSSYVRIWAQSAVIK